MQRMMIPALSEMTAFWKEIPCNPSTEPGKGMMAAPGMKERPPAGGPEATIRGRTAGVRAAPPEGSEGGRTETPPPCSSSAGPAWRAGLAGAARQGRGRRCGPRVHSTGHRQRERSRGDRPRGLCAQSDTVWRTEEAASNQRPEQATRARKQQPQRKRGGERQEDRHGGWRLSLGVQNTAECSLSPAKGLFT